MNIQKKAFTLIELAISISIVAILATSGFYSYISSLNDARDSDRKANMWLIKSSLSLYKLKRWAYPIPWNKFNITNSWVIVALQWKLDNNVVLTTIEKIPTDPLTESNYFYSVTTNRQEYQVALTLENWDFPIADLEWDYRSVSINVLPNIMVAYSLSGATFEIGDSAWSNRNYFILDGWLNLPYSLMSPYEPFFNNWDIDYLMSEWSTKFWQNSDYKTCLEIQEAWKLIHETWSEEYQLLEDTWVLVSTWCTF